MVKYESFVDMNSKDLYGLIKEKYDKVYYQELQQKTTLIGVHRDDFSIYLDNVKINNFGSQGQHRTAMLSLKLSEVNIIEDEIGEKPVLLLDDFMSELDSKRRNHFLEKIDDTQVIITCTDKIDIEKNKILIYNVNDGKVLRGGI